MAADTSSSITSTSHTLTAPSTMASALPTTNGSLKTLMEILNPDNRHAFLQPDAHLPTESLNLVKNTLEAFAGQVSDQQQILLNESRKRKRGGDRPTPDVLKLRKIYVDGFDTNQVWQQAKRIIGGVLEFSEELLGEMDSRKEIGSQEDLLDLQQSDEDDDDDDELEILSNEDEDGDDDEEDVDEEEELDEELLQKINDEAPFSDAELSGADNDDAEEDDGSEEGSETSYAEDPDGLNDGFFSIDEFNKQTQWFEDQDAKGNPYTDQASDDEEVDWDADPNAPSTKKKASKKEAEDIDSDNEKEEGDDEEEAEDEEDDGPTFGDMALDAPEGDSEDEAMDAAMDDEEENNANGVYYKDFFAPPQRKSNGNSRPRKAPRHKQEQPTEQDMERAISDVRRDLFDDESEMEDSEDALSDASAGDPKSRRSAHERRQAKLAEEIRKLEAASVAKREWTLSGEATAAERPVNSLLEQDLDFEYVGKPVPVITPEVSESIEELIKRRILSQEFDEVLRRRPDSEAVPKGTRRGLADVEDVKSSKGLADIYEEEHVKNTNPDTYVSQSDEKLQKEEKEIEAMWKDVCGRLDALSSWHYKPKPVTATLSVVADVGTITMEDAQPATAQGISGENSRMAPQEVYKAGGDSAAQGEVVNKDGLPIARQEMSREDKTRRRRRHKERVRKAGTTGPAGKTRAGISNKAQTIADLKKGGVKVINRKGEITDVDGNKVKAAKAMSSKSFKL